MHAHYTDWVTWSEGREGANGDEKGVGVGVGSGVGIGDGNGDGVGTGTLVREQPQHGDGGRSGYKRMSPRQEWGTEREGGTGAKAGRRNTQERERRENERFGVHHIRNKAEQKSRHCHPAGGIIFVDKR